MGGDRQNSVYKVLWIGFTKVFNYLPEKCVVKDTSSMFKRPFTLHLNTFGNALPGGHK